MTTLDEAAVERILDREERLPPFQLVRAFSVFCGELHEPAHPKLIQVLCAWFMNGICKHIPEGMWPEDKYQFYTDFRKWDADKYAPLSEPTVPLLDLLPMGDIVQSIQGHFLYDAAKLADHNLLSGLRMQLKKNDAEAYGLSVWHRSKTDVDLPPELDWEPYAFVQRFLHSTPFYDFFANTQVPFRIPRKTFASHGIVLAPPNHGKSQLLGSLISGFLSEPDPVGVFVLDPHGDLYSTLRNRVDPLRLVLLDPDTNPPPLNFLDFGNSTEAQTLATFSYLMDSLSDGLSSKQGALIPFLLKLLKQIPHASIDTLREVVDEKVKNPTQSKFAPYIERLQPIEKAFFHNQFYLSRMRETLDSIGWRLYSALSSDAFRQMFSPPASSSDVFHNSFDADAAMRDRKVVLVKGARQALGDAGMQVFLQFVVAQFFSAALRRERIDASARHLGILFCDEAHHIFNPQTANILTECRKYGLGFVAATQVVQQIPDDVKAAIYGATAIKIAGPVSHSDASILSREMYCTTEFIRSMKAKEHSHADWAFYVSGMTDKAVKVSMPYGALEALPKFKQLPQVRLKPEVSSIAQTYYDIPVEETMDWVDYKTHEGPSKPEPSREVVCVPAEADTTTLSQSTDDPTKPAKGRPF